MLLLLFDMKTLKRTRNLVKSQRKIALGEVSRVKNIRRSEKDGLKITDNSIM